MREIKFRGFRTVQKDWVYGNLIVDENGTKYLDVIGNCWDNPELLGGVHDEH